MKKLENYYQISDLFRDFVQTHCLNNNRLEINEIDRFCV